MHEDLARLPNRLFYENLLQTAAACNGNLRPEGFDWPDEERTAFIHVDGSEKSEGRSVSNESEAHAIATLIQYLMAPGDVRMQDIIVLTAYKGQRKILQKHATNDIWVKCN